ncbi:MAG: aldo/keto reductase [Lachnospiraceae bacterium]|nr:aldo/keto reductase [Lachnospiraceae bacterium]
MKVRLGKTEITVNKDGFGALPIQRISTEDAAKLVRRAYESGMDFFDTARAYTDSEEKVGIALKDVRDKVIIATKTGAQNADGFWKDLETSLHNLQTDHVDIYQFHNPPFCPKPGGEDGLYDAILAAKSQGKVRHIGITNHRLHVAKEAIASGLYETIQFPLCYLATEKDLEIVELSRKADMGFIGMKSLSGGLITNVKAAAAFAAQFDNVVPIWGIQREKELDDFLAYIDEFPVIDDEIRSFIEQEKINLAGDFCRSCGYCLPCPMEIDIPQCARMSQLIRRAPSAGFLKPEWQEKMGKIRDCIGCGHCKSKCPYGLNTPELLKKNLADYEEILSGRIRL